jgi:hypothetical protein
MHLRKRNMAGVLAFAVAGSRSERSPSSSAPWSQYASCFDRDAETSRKRSWRGTAG